MAYLHRLVLTFFLILVIFPAYSDIPKVGQFCGSYGIPSTYCGTKSQTEQLFLDYWIPRQNFCGAKVIKVVLRGENETSISYLGQKQNCSTGQWVYVSGLEGAFPARPWFALPIHMMSAAPVFVILTSSKRLVPALPSRHLIPASYSPICALAARACLRTFLCLVERPGSHSPAWHRLPLVQTTHCLDAPRAVWPRSAASPQLFKTTQAPG